MAAAILAAAAVLTSCATVPRTPQEAELAAVRERAEAAMRSLERSGSAREGLALSHDEPGAAVPLPEPGPGGCRWVRANGSVAFGASDTKVSAEALAVAQARARAVGAVGALDLQHRFLDLEQEGQHGSTLLLESFLRASTRARVFAERLVSSGLEDQGDCRACRYAVVIDTCLAPVRTDADPGFALRVALSDTRLKDGEEVRVRVHTTRDAYVYLFSVGSDWKAWLIYPVGLEAPGRLRAGEELEFPEPERRARGQRLRAQLPTGAREAIESLRVLAAREPLPEGLLRPLAGGQGASYLELVRALEQLGLVWVEEARIYSIVRPFSVP